MTYARSLLRFLGTFVWEACSASFILALSVIFPCTILLMSIGHSPSDIPNAMRLINADHKMAELILIVLPLGVIYVLNGTEFAYRVGRSPIDLPIWLFRMAFVLPLGVMAVFQALLYHIILVLRDKVLDGEWYYYACSAIITSLVCILLMDVFMNIFRKIDLESLQVRAGES